MSLLYAVEAWVLAIFAWAWLTLRNLIPRPPLLENLCVYSTLLVSTLNLGLSAALPSQRSEVGKAYLGLALALWTYLTYALFDGLQIYDTGSQNVPADLCCPNQDVPAMNRYLYFGGIDLFLVPGAVTLAFQTAQVLVAGGAVVLSDETVWPGNGWGYSVASLLASVYLLRFSGSIEAPCPDGSFDTLFGLSLNYGLLFGLFGFCMLGLILLDGLRLPTSLQFTARVVCLLLVSLLCASVVYASHGRGMLTLPLLLLLIKAWLPAVWGIVEPWWSRSTPMLVEALPNKRRTRWVMPIQTDLPRPIVMEDPPPDPGVVRSSKKRL